ncbi:MAG: T9SS type A sorting domain-containing protein [Bacteroidales bacterium]|nr:T9SS type A sorting domain-containing protein [Bacteroidales bacterium]
MKKVLLALLFANLFILLQAGIIEQTYYFTKPGLNYINGYQILDMEGLMQNGLTGEPTLPYQEVSLLLPPGEEIYAVDLYCDHQTELPGTYTLYPMQPSRPLSEPGNGSFEINEAIYAQTGIYPSTSGGHTKTAFMNGYAIGLYSFTPVNIVPATGKVTYYKKVKVIFHTRSSEKGILALSNQTSKKGISKKLSGFIQNPEMISQYPTATKDSDDYDFLIVTPSQFESDFQEFVDMYNNRGIKTELITTETIYSSITGQDQPEKIRNFIIDQYQNHNIEFVLLGGDVEHVPYRGFYCYVQSGSGYEDSDIPADLYYAALDGTWNDDGDNRWGEPGEDDLLPEVAVGRFPFSNAGELENLIHKSYMYQNEPVLGEFNETTMAGEWLYSNPDTYGSDYLEMLIGYHDENGYVTWGIPETVNYHKLYESVSSWSANDLRAEINAGRQFIHHVGHANSTYVAYMSNSDITNSNFSGANGVDHNYTLFQSHGCICGAFDDNDCIMEKMVTIDNFAVSVIGNSRYGWFNEGQTEGPAAHLHREMVDAMYHHKMQHLGAAFTEAKIQTAPWVTAPGQWEEGALRWNFYDINILGDPALSVWTAEPISIQTNFQNSIPIGVTSTDVNVSSGGAPLEGFLCAVIKDEIIYGKGYTDASGHVTISFDPIFSEVGEAQLVVSGYNCLPVTYPVDIIPNDGAYVIFSEYQVDDSQGNANGQPDYDEILKLDMEMENVGAENADNVQVTISSNDTYISISDDTELFGTILANSVMNVEGAFEFITSDHIPDQHEVQFELEATGDDVWVSNFSIVINAPDLHIGAITVNDSDQGNGNGILDPGETADIEVEMMNTGHISSQAVMGMLTSNSSDLTVIAGSENLGSLSVNTTEVADFTVEVSDDAPLGSTVNLWVELLCGMYYEDLWFDLPVGLSIEDFESGDFNAYGWQFDGSADWAISSNQPYEGTYCAKSGTISNQQTSEMMVEMDVSIDGEISFFLKVSSEADYDYLRFYIDNNEQDSWSGEEGWQEASFDVTAGTHTFKWVYEKDYSVANGEDCAWIDYIIFPSAGGSANPLSVFATALPAAICEGESSQLNASATGGSGNYTYSWSPATGLSDPDIQNPVATPTATITYEVTVDDGNSTITDEIMITVNPVPETPAITQSGDHLVSDAASGNQWYNSDGAISGATGQTYYPTATDDYYVMVENAFGCQSEASNSIYFVYTGTKDLHVTQNFSVYPNPVIDHFSVAYRLTQNSRVSIALYDKLGRIAKVLTDNEQQIAGIYKLDFGKDDLTPGVYFLQLMHRDGTHTAKIVIEN